MSEAGADFVLAEHDFLGLRSKLHRFLKSLIHKIFGITVEPTGAFYVLANAQRFSSNSLKFAFNILKEAKVGVTPGIDFGTNAEGYIRFSYANSLKNIKEGMNRLEKYLTQKLK